MNKVFGLPIWFWIFIVIVALFGAYLSKTVYGLLYKAATGESLPESYYKNNIYGQPDYRYELGKKLLTTN